MKQRSVKRFQPKKDGAGRNYKGIEERTIVMSIRMDPTTRKYLEEMSKERKARSLSLCSMSDIMKDAIALYFLTRIKEY